MADYDQFKGQSRLSKFALPKRYHINLNPNLLSCKFSGQVSVTVDVVSPTKFLVLNAADLNVDSHSISFTPSSSSQELRSVGVGVIEEDEILVLEFPMELPIGIGILSVSFVGTLNDLMKGFYRRSIKRTSQGRLFTHEEGVDENYGSILVDNVIQFEKLS